MLTSDDETTLREYVQFWNAVLRLCVPGKTEVFDPWIQRLVKGPNPVLVLHQSASYWLTSVLVDEISEQPTSESVYAELFKFLCAQEQIFFAGNTEFPPNFGAQVRSIVLEGR